MTIRAIIFDYGEVLNVDVHGDDIAAERAKAAARLGLQPEDLWTYLFDCEASSRWMTGKLTWEKFWIEVLAPHGITDPHEIREFSRRVLPATKRLNPDMVSLLSELKGRYNLALLSNASWKEPEMRRMLYNDFELPDDTFDVIVTSSSVGAVKPQVAIYREVLARLGAKPEEVLFIDDMPQFTAVAASMGMHTHTFTSPVELRRYLADIGITAF